MIFYRKKERGEYFVKKGIIVCLVVLAVIVIALNAEPGQTEVHSLADYAYSELESSTIYRADDVTIIDAFAVRTESRYDVTTNVIDYYLMAYRDKNDRLVMAVLKVDDDDEIFSRLSLYSKDDSQNIGDCILNGYVKTGGKLANLDTKLKKYYNDAVDYYGPILEEYFTAPEYLFTYHCNAYTDPLKR